ncbi:hypothetical protein KI387_035420, partial [Taxus chinensis]
QDSKKKSSTMKNLRLKAKMIKISVSQLATLLLGTWNLMRKNLMKRRVLSAMQADNHTLFLPARKEKKRKLLPMCRRRRPCQTRLRPLLKE